jgi:hypothetical protein
VVEAGLHERVGLHVVDGLAIDRDLGETVRREASYRWKPRQAIRDRESGGEGVERSVSPLEAESRGVHVGLKEPDALNECPRSDVSRRGGPEVQNEVRPAQLERGGQAERGVYLADAGEDDAVADLDDALVIARLEKFSQLFDQGGHDQN